MKKFLTLGIILIFICVGIQPVFAVNISLNPISKGNTLYVGGTGPGNYTTIQDAIDDANDGDTVFVYDDSSPYYENVVINKSINLIGENKNTTIIDADDLGLKVETDNVYIKGFTIKCYEDGIIIYADNTTISDNIIKAYGNFVLWGIYIYGKDNVIEYNIISYFSIGIIIHHSEGTIIRNNYVCSNSWFGILFECSSSNIIINNSITENYLGIGFDDIHEKSKYNIIKSNNISYNEFGLDLGGRGNTVSENNFIENDVSFLTILYWDRGIRRNKWKNNYWSDYQGILGFLKIIKGRILVVTMHDYNYYPWFNIDWFPVKKPYDIEA